MGRLTSENRPQRGKFWPDLQAHTPAMGQKVGEKWTAAVDLQPTLPKSDRLLGMDERLLSSMLLKSLAMAPPCKGLRVIVTSYV